MFVIKDRKQTNSKSGRKPKTALCLLFGQPERKCGNAKQSWADDSRKSLSKSQRRCGSPAPEPNAGNACFSARLCRNVHKRHSNYWSPSHRGQNLMKYKWHTPVLIASFVLLTPLQSHWPSCCYINTVAHWPQDLCTIPSVWNAVPPDTPKGALVPSFGSLDSKQTHHLQYLHSLSFLLIVFFWTDIILQICLLVCLSSDLLENRNILCFVHCFIPSA